jgi:peptide deformylase
MAVLPIRFYPDPVLRVRCPEVESFDGDLERLANDMIETMYAAPGVGLAAPQVGVELRLAVVNITAGEESNTLRVLVNPEIFEPTGKETDEEGCLSIPDITEKVTRPEKIRVQAHGLDGQPIEFEADGLLARVVCHEVDHLDGVLFIDRLVGLRKERVKRQLRKLSRKQEAAR